MFNKELINSKIAVKCTTQEEIITYVAFLNKYGTEAFRKYTPEDINVPAYIVNGTYGSNWGFYSDLSHLGDFVVVPYWQARTNRFIKKERISEIPTNT